jgi:uncharacterized membrane protein
MRAIVTTVRESIEVGVPVSTAYNQWTQFKEFPKFMEGVESVEQLDSTTLRWVAEIAGVERQWEAKITAQRPDERIAWASSEGPTNSGQVSFTPIDAGRTGVDLELNFEPQGPVEKAGVATGAVQRRAKKDLERFKQFIEERGEETGAWRRPY